MNISSESERYSQFSPLSIDTDQWRRDIRTFAETTNQALEAIVAELSNRCSQERRPASDQLPHGDDAQPVSAPEISGRSSRDNESDPRLGDIRQQLAERLARLNS